MAFSGIAKTIIRNSGFLQGSGYFGEFGFFLNLAIARGLGKLVSQTEKAQIDLPGGAKFEFRLSDSYWSRGLSKQFRYEPEIGHFIDNLGKEPFALLDCGANYGYWSVKTEKAQPNCKKIIAVEASSTTFAQLSRNLEINSSKVEPLQKAIFTKSDEDVFFEVTEAKHARAAITSDTTSEKTEMVKTISVLDLIDSLDPELNNVIVKLDIEGVEAKVLKETPPQIHRNFVFIYEDHGNDATCEATSAALEAGLTIYFSDVDGAFQRITSTDDASKVKHNHRRGYNFAAVRPGSDFDAILAKIAS